MFPFRKPRCSFTVVHINNYNSEQVISDADTELFLQLGEEPGEEVSLPQVERKTLNSRPRG